MLTPVPAELDKAAKLKNTYSESATNQSIYSGLTNSEMPFGKRNLISASLADDVNALVRSRRFPFFDG